MPPPRPDPAPPALTREQMLYLESSALQRAGQQALARQLLAELLRRDPAHVDGLQAAGSLALQAGDAAEALGLFDRTVAREPSRVEAHRGRADALKALNRTAEAVQAYQQVAALAPDEVEAPLQAGILLRDAGQLDEALVLLDGAVARQPRHKAALFHRAVTLRRLDRLDEAVATYDRLLAVDPSMADAHFNRANALQELRRLPEAIQAYRRAIALQPDHAEAHCNMACALLLGGDYANGLATYEWRWRSSFIQEPPPQFAQPAWRGAEPLQGKTILLYSEQGLGDTIQFSRYARRVAALGARVMVQAPQLLLPLLQGVGGIHVLAAKGLKELPPFDVHCPLMSLPLAFGTTLQNIPREGPYLRPPADRVDRWAPVVTRPGFNIGICWQGSGAGIGNARSFGVDRFAGIAALPGVRLYSLQKGPGSEQLATLPPGMTVQSFGDDFDGPGAAFLDSAALISRLDLVITTDTAIAHLAGALGKPVWVLLKHLPDWRWGLEGDTTPWYPTMRLFRQPRRGDWQPCFDAIHTALRAILALATAPRSA